MEARVSESLEELRHSLLERAFLYDHPDAYRAGVEATLRAITQARLEDRRLA